MLKCRVMGNATSTVKHSTMQGWKLLIAQPLMNDDQSADGEPLLVVDALGAGIGDIVIIGFGKGTRDLLKVKNSPIRWCVLGIVDE